MNVSKYLNRPAVALVTAVMVTASCLAAVHGIATAAVTNPAPAAQVSFTFDDGMRSAYSQAAPALQKYGMTGVSYVPIVCVGMTTVPNDCRANKTTPYMTWNQIRALQNTYGWEIGSHTVTHPLLASSGAWAGQPNKLTTAQVEQELYQSKLALAAQGINATAFASPYGDYDNTTLGLIAKYYTSHRGFADTGMNVWPHSDYLIKNMPVQAGVSVAQVRAAVDQAIANKQWLVLTFHDIKTNASTNPNDYEYRTADLEAIAAYVRTKQNAGQIRNTNISNALVSGSTADNQLPNSSFDAGIAGGWRTDNAAAVSLNTANNGSTPGVKNSVRFVPAATAARLYSPEVSVRHDAEYVIRNYLKISSRTGTGSMEFYIDEYDINGNWVSGQFKKAAAAAWTENLNFVYKPTSPSVVRASLQITNTAGSGITAYVDNIQWLTVSAPATPVQSNLVPNGTFDAGIAGGWRTDNAAVLAADTTGMGSPSNAQHSVRFAAGTANAHLFSPNIAVSSGKTYSLTSFLRLTTLTSSEVGYYIDEYDAAGNWVSGQYKYGVRTAGTGDVSFGYTPTGANVTSASLQLIVPANSGATGYFDDVRWYVQQ